MVDISQDLEDENLDELGLQVPGKKTKPEAANISLRGSTQYSSSCDTEEIHEMTRTMSLDMGSLRKNWKLRSKARTILNV